MRWAVVAALAALAKAADVEFGLFDAEQEPSGGDWILMSSADFTTHKAAFLASYNKLKGVAPISVFQSGNCCIAVKGGNKLMISGTPYGYQFPASTDGGIRCNPTGGYTDAAYQFYRSPQLSDEAQFSEQPGSRLGPVGGAVRGGNDGEAAHFAPHDRRGDTSCGEGALEDGGKDGVTCTSDLQATGATR